MIFNTALYYTAESAIKISIPIPSQTGELYYNGESQSPEWKNFNPKQVSISGEVSGISERTYTAIFSIIDKQTYVWEDGTDEDKYVDWVIGTRMYEWIPSRLPNLLSWNSVTYGANKYVCVADKSDKYIYSSDGLTWIENTLPQALNKPKIIYANGKFVIITMDSTKNSYGYYDMYSIYSTDGLTWTSTKFSGYSSSFSVSIAPGNIVFGNEKFVFPCDKYSFFSSDGITWTGKIISDSSTIYTNMAYGDGIFVATTNTVGRLKTSFSLNGETWINTNVNFPVTGTSIDCKISYGDGKFIIKSGVYPNENKSYVAYSTNAISWKIVEDNVSTGETYDLIYADNRFLDIRYMDTELGSTGMSYFSEDGITWREVPFPDGVNANCVGYGGNKFMAMDNGNYLFAYMETNHLALPTQKGTLTYNGSTQSPVWEEYQTDKMTISGQTSGTNAGTYTATFTPKSGFSWIDGGTGAKDVTWKIDKAKSYIPYVDSIAYTYSGNPITPIINNFNSSIMSVSGQTSGTNVGVYTISISLTNSNYEWIDGTTEIKNTSWEIAKANSTITLSENKIYVETKNPVVSFEISSHSGGNNFTWSANTGNNKYIDVNISGTTVTVTAQKITYSQEYVQFTLTIYNTGDENHTSSSANCAISYKVYNLDNVPSTDVSEILSENSWKTIGKVSADGNAPNYWSIGDTKPITLNGTIGTEIFENVSVDTFIIGFDHNKDIESPNEHITHFQIGKVGTKLVSLVDEYYGDDGPLTTNYFCIDHSNDEDYTSGWKDSDMFNQILKGIVDNTVYNALPSDLKSSMKTVKKFTHNNAVDSSTLTLSSFDVTENNETLSLLAEYELFGVRTYANTYEQEKQKQYEYYSDGNSKVFYKRTGISSESISGDSCGTWLRSPAFPEGTSLLSMYCETIDGEIYNSPQELSYGISPIFFI